MRQLSSLLVSAEDGFHFKGVSIAILVAKFRDQRSKQRIVLEEKCAFIEDGGP